MNNIKLFITAEEAADFLRVKKSTLYSWVYQKKVPYRKHGRLLVFSVEDLRIWSENQSVGVSEERVLSLDEIRGKCYNSRPKADSLTAEYQNRRVKQSTHYDPFIEKESS